MVGSVPAKIKFCKRYTRPWL